MAEPQTTDTFYPSFFPPPLSGDHFCNSSSDQALLRNSISDLSFLIDGDGDFELNFEDSVDDLNFASEFESFFTPVDATNREMSGDSTPQESVSDILEAPTNASSSLGSGKMVVDQKFQVEKEATTKMKQEIEEDTSEEESSRNNKYRRLDQHVAACGGDEKKNVRLMRNRESAHLSRQRKKHYVEELEDKVKTMHFTISELNSKMSSFMTENVTLRQQVGPMYRPRHPPLAPMAYPWMLYPAYMVKQQGSRVALLPIPRLKPQQTLAKVKKAKTTTKKVASVSVLGLLFSLFLFGALAPIVNNTSYREYKSNYLTVTDHRVYDQSRRRVLDVNSNRADCKRDSDQGVGRNISDAENLGPPQNSSEPLVASLFVPRNEKLVKIDGNLIIHSVLASEKAMASEKKNQRKTSVTAIAKGISPAFPLPDSARTGDMSKNLYSENLKALSSSVPVDDTVKEQLKSTTANGKMQQWFREGVAGPMFSSGMCTEVFQFDVSRTSGAIYHASPPTQQPTNTTDTHKGKKNRKILRGGPPVSDFNLTKDHNSSSKENFEDTKPAPSMVVSVLVDPREGGDGDTNGMIGATKSLSRVFIVLLVDSVKYVTYSCVLPQPEDPHLVTT